MFVYLKQKPFTLGSEKGSLSFQCYYSMFNEIYLRQITSDHTLQSNNNKAIK